ncbi:hypothetical protein [Paenibacillus sp. NRS-1781]|uniref:hypothetical protein n=1 Tax=Paenibacillus sp. NRS-1781 TaxID=3233905 RepID=UPI003D2BF9EC
MKLYFPTSSLNFNDMLATESISPKNFYSNRKFGTKRHFTTELAINEYFITLFSTPPMFNIVEQANFEYEEYPIIIDIDYDESFFKLFDLSENVYATQETIYFNPGKVKFNFFSEEHVRVVLAKSKLVEETKLVSKYRENFRLINKQSLTKISLDQITFPRPNIELQEKQLFFDKIHNQIKGLIYAFLVKYHEYQNDLNSNSVLDQIENIIKQIDTKKNLFFEVAFDQLVTAKKYYEKGLAFDKKNLNEIQYPQLIKDYAIDNIQLNKNIISDTEEYSFFNKIINYLVQTHNNDNVLSKQEIIELLKYLKANIPEKNSAYANDLHKITDRVVNRNYKHDIKDIHSLVAQNLLVFLLKQDKLEEFELILHENTIKNYFISYCFLGVVTGFSNLSKLITHSLYLNKKLSKEIDNQTSKLQKMIWARNNKPNLLVGKENNEDLYSSELFPSNKDMDTAEYIEIEINSRIQNIRESKKIKTLIKKKKIILTNQVIVLFEEIEEDIFIHFYKDGIDCFNILLRHKNNLNIEELNSFKSSLKLLGYGSDIRRVAQGNYPIFLYYKVGVNTDYTLTKDEKETLLDYLDIVLES